MKTQKKLLLIGLLIITCNLLTAQIPQKFNYQAVARNNNAIIENGLIGVRLTITQGTGGASLYQETQSPTTNAFGIFSLQVGGGTPVSGNFSTIDWKSGDKWLQVEMDPAGGTAYANMGSSELLSVPYALNSGDGWIINGNNISNPNVGTVNIENGNLSLNDNEIRLHSAVDGNHIIKYDPIYDGIHITGWLGGVLSASHGGIDVLRWTDFGNVGIGIGSPASKLHLSSSDTMGLKVDYSGSGTNHSIVLKTTNSLVGSRPQIDFENSVGLVASLSPASNIFNFDVTNGLRVRELGSNYLTTFSVNSNGDGYIKGGLRVDSGTLRVPLGRVGIGTNSPGDKLSIRSGALSFHDTINDLPYVGMDYDGALDGMRFRVNILNTALNTDRMFISRVSGNVGINTTAPGYTLEVAGTAGKPGGGSWAVTSDARLKQDVKPYSDGLQQLLLINPVRYHYNEASGYSTRPEYVGVIAQELKEIVPYMVGTYQKNEMEYYNVDNSAMTYMLINAVKEQQKLIQDLNASNAVLTATMNSLKAEVEAIRSESGNAVSNTNTRINK